MPNAPKNPAKRGGSSALQHLKKRAKGTASQPININSYEPLGLLKSPSPLPLANAFQALVSASQAPTFEARIRESRAADSITAPPKDSEHATAAASEAPNEESEEEIEAFDAHLMDNHDGIDWNRLKKFQLPLSTYKYKKSWVYQHGYRVASRSDLARISWVCHICFRSKATDFGRGIFHTTSSISAAEHHLANEKVGHGIVAPGKTPKMRLESSVYSALQAGKPLAQAVANQLSGFNIQQFRLAAVGGLLKIITHFPSSKSLPFAL